MALKITESHQGAMTEMVKGHPHLSLRSPQIKGIQSDTEVKQDLRKSLHPPTEMLHNLIEMTVTTSGRIEEALDLKLKVPMGHRTHIATSLLVDTTSLYLEEVQLTGAKDSRRLPLIIVGMPMCMGHTACQSHLPLTPATKGSGPP